VQANEIQTFTLADGQTVTIVKEGLQLGEALVNPSIVNPDLHSLAPVVVNSCMCHPDAGFRKVLILILQLSLHQLFSWFLCVPAGWSLLTQV
jgi:hypothetical protein